MGLAPDQSIRHFQLIEQIGPGGMGVVYRATDTKLRRDVAIKVLPDDFAHDAERLELIDHSIKEVRYAGRSVALGGKGPREFFPWGLSFAYADRFTATGTTSPYPAQS